MRKLTYNLAHNLGMIYDMTEEAIFMSLKLGDVYESTEFWARMGTIVGSNFQNIFEDPKNYYTFDELHPNGIIERN